MRQLAPLFDVSPATVCRGIQRLRPLLVATVCEGVTVLGNGAYINTGLVMPTRRRPGRALLSGLEEDNAEHRRVWTPLPR
ncbi:MULTISPECIES: DDE transposase family protein [Streptomyces]|uniref:DDE transposase family protein n=1 Tax=Streptomyces lavendulocolor TaxID=67316 RepID=UPI0007CD71ED|nr:hypothetical protein A4V12_04855 [Streptomyces noursei]